MPINIVDGHGFQIMMHLLEQACHIPSRGTITSCMDNRYKNAKSVMLVQRASDASKAAMTTYSWTALTTESYMTITCHYITEDW